MEPIIHDSLITDHPEWNESYYFVFYDKSLRLGGMSRIGFKPNKNEAMTFFFLFLPDGSAAGYFQTMKLKQSINQLKVKGMSHGWHLDETWDYNFKGNMIFVKNPLKLPDVRVNPKLIEKTESVKMNLKFAPLNDPYEYSKYMTPESLEIGKKSGDKHWEQIGIVNGEILINDEKVFIKNCLSQRDHTYGVRDWTGVGNWLYYVIWFSKDLAINPAAIITEDGKFSTGGFIFKNGRNIPLETIKIIDQQFEPNGIYPISSILEIIDTENNTHILKAFVGPIIPIPFTDDQGHQSILIQSFGNFELDEIKGGYGTFETLRKKI
jgi:hypothetical protein